MTWLLLGHCVRATLLLALLPLTTLAANPDLVGARVERDVSDPRHASQFMELSYTMGSVAEKAALVDAIGTIEGWIRDSSLYAPTSASREAFNAAASHIETALSKLVLDIRSDNSVPGDHTFVLRWASQFEDRVREAENEDSGHTTLFFDRDLSVAIDPLEDDLALHVWFAWRATYVVWRVFAGSANSEIRAKVLERQLLWSSFNQMTYSMYPWEQWLNGASLRFGDLDTFPSHLWIVAHPSLAVELRLPDGGRLSQTMASEIFLLEFGIQALRRSGSKGMQTFSRSIGVGAVLSFSDDAATGLGGLLHYGSALHIGALWRDDPKPGSTRWSALIGLDLYGLLADR